MPPGRCSDGLRANEIDERIRYDEFFGVRRVQGLEADSLAETTFLCLADTLEDLTQTQLGVHELVALLRGMVLITDWIDGTPPSRQPASRVYPRTGGEAALSRFRLGHLVFALVCNFGCHHLRRASASLESGESPVGHLEAAAVCVRASTAAMWYSTSLPQAVYLSVVRPPMDDASTKDHGFSGLDNFDFRRMREAWEDLLPVLSSRLTESDGEESLRVAAHRLYETIMEDNEHHILIAAEALGVAPSLKTERTTATVPGLGGISAVAALRLNAEERRAMLSAGCGTLSSPHKHHLRSSS